MHTLESLAAAADLSRVPTDELRTLSLAALREMGDFSISQQAFTTRSLFSDRAERELMARGVSFYTMRTEDMEPPDTDTPCDCPRCGRILNHYVCKCGNVDRRDADEAMQQAVKDADPDAFAEAFWAIHGDDIAEASRKASEISPTDFARRVIAAAADQIFSL